MTPLERLLAEELPTGSFGDARPPRTAGQAPRRSEISPAQAAANKRALEEALGGKPKRKPRLRVIPGGQAAA